MRIKCTVYALFMVLSLTFTKAQDMHFSQFFNSPLTLNPASTGFFDADWRVANNYRNQWSSIDIPYQTIAVSFDRQFYIFSEKFSGGIVIVYDHSGHASLTVNKIFVSLAYHKNINGNVFHFGLQGGPILKSFSSDQLTFMNQWDHGTGAFESGLPSGESFSAENIAYGDFNAGAIWSRKMNKITPQVGIAAFHVNYPKESFNNTDNRLSLRTAVHGGALINTKGRLYIQPNLLFMLHKRANLFNLGTNVGYNLPENRIKAEAIYVGGYFRDNTVTNVDASYGVIGLKINHWEVAFSYDVNLSTLKTGTQHRGAFEISVIFTSGSTVLNMLTDPCNRY